MEIILIHQILLIKIYLEIHQKEPLFYYKIALSMEIIIYIKIDNMMILVYYYLISGRHVE